MTVIGLTGGFGTGKTTVARMFARSGAKVIDVDAISHRLAAPRKPLWKEYVRLFGAHVLRSDNTLQRKKIAQIVFSNRQKLAALMRYSHPLILSEMRRQIKQARPKNGIVVVDLPLLFEDRLEPEFDLVVVVAANQKNVLRRCAEKRAMTRAEILRRIKNQKPLSLKKRRADAVIDNNGAQATTFARVKRLYASLLP